jgi:hypothetical protein
MGKETNPQASENIVQKTSNLSTEAKGWMFSVASLLPNGLSPTLPFTFSGLVF